jgi:hypothetical protein
LWLQVLRGATSFRALKRAVLSINFVNRNVKHASSPPSKVTINAAVCAMLSTRKVLLTHSQQFTKPFQTVTLKASGAGDRVISHQGIINAQGSFLLNG